MVRIQRVLSTPASFWALNAQLVQVVYGATVHSSTGSSLDLESSGEPVVSWLVHPGAHRFDSSQASGFGAASVPSQTGTEVSPRQMQALLKSRDAGAGGTIFLSSEGAGKGSENIAPASVVELRSLYASEYVGVIGVGTQHGGNPENYLSVIFDTGSAELWVASDLCNLPPCTDVGRSRFNHSRSTTFRAPASGAQLSTYYGTGELHGLRGFDDIRVGTLVARDQPLGLISLEIGASFQNLPLDGIVGLAFSSLADGGEATLFDGLLQAGALRRREFGFYLHPDPRRGGALLWGGTDSRLCNGETMKFPVLHEHYWGLDLVEFRVGNFVLNGSSEGNVTASGSLRGSPADSARWPLLVVDSGTTFFTADEQTSQAVAAVANVPIGACASVSHLPPLVFTIRDVQGKLRDLVVQPEKYMVRSSEFKNSCIPGFVTLDMPPGVRPVMILGEIFMRHFFTVFSRGDGGLGSHVDFTPVQIGGEADEFFAELASRESEFIF